MRVNITYSVDLESVPTEVNKLMADAESALRVVHGLFDRTAGDTPLQRIEGINAIREQLVELDSRLGDCANILSGYMDVKTKMAIEKAQPTPDPLEVETND